MRAIRRRFGIVMIAFMAQVARYSCATRRPYAAPAARVTKQAAHVIAAVQEQASSTRMTVGPRVGRFPDGRVVRDVIQAVLLCIPPAYFSPLRTLELNSA